jgi:hypothetical protein
MCKNCGSLRPQHAKKLVYRLEKDKLFALAGYG